MPPVFRVSFFLPVPLAMEDQLTSRTLALARLVYLCVSDASLGRLARHRLTAALLPLASGSAAGADMAVEPPFGALLQTLVSAGVPQSWVGEYARQLRELVAGDPSPDDIWSIVYDLYSLTLPEAEPGAPAAPPAPPRVARSSAFGLFARRARVSFDLAPFEAPHPAGLTLLIPAEII